MSIPQTHKALVLSSHAQPADLKIHELPTPSPTPGSAVVKVLSTLVYSGARGICTGKAPFPKLLPLVPGSAAICRIMAVGPDCVSLTPGQLVFVDVTVRARDDPATLMLQGLFAMGSAQKLMETEFRHGTWAEYAKVPLENVTPIDEDLLVNKMGYTYNELAYLGILIAPLGGLDDINIGPGKTIVIGPATGTYGGAAVTAALALGARVVAVGRNETQLQNLLNILGPVYGGRLSTVKITNDVDADAAAILKASPGGKGVDAFLDLSPTFAVKPTHITSCMMSLKIGGQVSFMGGIQGVIDFPYTLVTMKDLSIKGRLMYLRSSVAKLIQMVEAGNLKLKKAESGLDILGVYKLEDVHAALDIAAENPGYGKLAILAP